MGKRKADIDPVSNYALIGGRNLVPKKRQRPESATLNSTVAYFMENFEKSSSANDCVPLLPEVLKLKQDGDGHLLRKEFQDGIGCFTSALEIQSHPALFTQRAACNFGLAEYRSAQLDAQSAVKFGSTSQAYLILLESSIVLGDTIIADEAVKLLRTRHRHLDINKQEMALVTLKALFKEVEILRQNGDYRTLVVFSGQAQKIAHGCTSMKLLTAEAFIKLKKLDEALAICRDMLKANDACTESRYLRVMCMYLQNNLDDAIEEINHATQLGVHCNELATCLMRLSNLRTLRLEAKNLLDQQNYIESKHKLMESLEIMNKLEYKNVDLESKLFFQLSSIEEKLGHLQSALKWCNCSVKACPENLNAIVFRAHLHVALHFFSAAIKDYKMAITLDPGNCKYQLLINEAKKSRAAVASKVCKIGHYRILGLTPTATQENIKNAYKKKALLHHPDKHARASAEVKSANESKFKLIVKAYEILSDPGKRQEYDKLMNTEGTK